MALTKNKKDFSPTKKTLFPKESSDLVRLVGILDALQKKPLLLTMRLVLFKW